MPEMHLHQYLDTLLHALDGLEEPHNTERSKEIANIRKQIETYKIGLQRVDTKNMVMCILAGLEDLSPRIDALVIDGNEERSTWPAPNRETSI